MPLTEQEKHELDQAIELTPQEKRYCLSLRIKRIVIPAIERLGYSYSWTATRRDPNGDYVFTFTSSESPTLELRIKSGE